MKAGRKNKYIQSICFMRQDLNAYKPQFKVTDLSFSLIIGETSLSTPELRLHFINRFQIEHFFLNFLLL